MRTYTDYEDYRMSRFLAGKPIPPGPPLYTRLSDHPDEWTGPHHPPPGAREWVPSRRACACAWWAGVLLTVGAAGLVWLVVWGAGR